MESESLSYNEFIKYKNLYVDIPDDIKDYVEKVHEIQSKNKKLNSSWKRNNIEKTNWLVTNKINQSSDDKLISEFRGILNKISESNFSDMMKQMFELDITTIGQLEILVDLIFKKALGEPVFSSTYSLLCAKFLPVYIIVDSNKVQFRTIFMNKCQMMFDECIKIKSEEDIKESKFMNKKEMVGLMSFIGSLYNESLISNSIIYRCLLSLIKKSDNRDISSVECLCSFVANISKKFRISCPNDFEKILDLIKVIKNSKNIHMKDKFAIMDVLDAL